jgi:hypothetical protein
MPQAVAASDLLADLVARAQRAGADAADALLSESAGLAAIVKALILIHLSLIAIR